MALAILPDNAGHMEGQMTATFATETNASFVSSAFIALIGAVRTLQARRTQKRAYAELLEMDPGRLDDLGITVSDVREALGAPLSASSSLEARRSARARNWASHNASAA
jgi:uncharacterized protein YjiS (DUF1127 family)